MRHDLDFVDERLEELEKNNLYRKLRYGTVRGSKITINGRKLINLSSNDYLGITSSGIKIRQMQSSSRLVSGNDDAYEKLEGLLARHKSYQGSLVYPTGYMANMGAISAIAQKGDVIYSDELNHASIIESCKLTGARVSVYRHNDMEDLGRKIQRGARRKFIITEGVFSMDGDISPLKQIAEISGESDAITLVDDAHGDFVLGNDGRGTPNHCNVEGEIDLYTSSLSKGLGSFGGYVASHSNVIDLCINRSKQFIYTSALPSFLLEYSSKRIQSDRNARQMRLERNRRYLAEGLDRLGYEIDSQTHIIPIIIGDEKKTVRFGEFLMDNGVFVQPIRYPTVPRNQARLRISVTAWLSRTDITKALEVFERAYGKFYR